MITGSKELIRDMNSHLILEMILKEDTISRAALSKASGLTKATVSAIVQKLIEQNLVIEVGNDNTSLGRKPILLTFHANCGYALSIDVNANTISAMICNLRGENCRLKLYPNHAGREEILPLLISIIRDMTASLEDTPYGVVGIGLGIHGTVYHNQITFTPYSPYEQLPFQEVLEQEFGIPIYLENEANLSVIGEHTFYYHTPNLIGISIHTGIGVGILINNQLYTGANGNAGEFGHSIIEPDGRPCPCGNSGCLEQYASERSILKQFAATKGLEHADIDVFVAACHKQDDDALALLDDFIRYMSYGINNLLNTFNPDMIVINSSFTTYFPEVLRQIQDKLQNRMRMHCVLVPSGLQDTSILLGAACLCIRQFLGIQHLKLRKPLGKLF
ncbi:ROK family transcriptional regulator [bacterium 1XD21-13]|nr:ROK family transcriptional regulator [bacterium 1XD21-13]